MDDLVFDKEVIIFFIFILLILAILVTESIYKKNVESNTQIAVAQIYSNSAVKIVESLK